jgi:hypothetical protein
MKKLSFGAVAVAVMTLCAAGSASAGVVSLNFEGINATYPSGYAFIGDFYNGGMSSDGTTGTNYGIGFSSNAQAICLNSLTVDCSNTSRGGMAPGSDQGGLFFLSGAETFMNVAAGFTTGFSFNYSSAVVGAVNVYDGANGTGIILGTLNLNPNLGSCPGYGASFCPFSPSGVNFAGTAHSIGFAGVANEIVFDDVTFGSNVPGVPEPETYALMLAGLATVAGIARRRKASV